MFGLTNPIFPQLFTFSPLSKKVEARTHLQIGQMLFTYTNSIDLARSHLEQAWTLSQPIQGFDDIKFDAACTLSQLYQQQNQSHTAKTILRKAIENSQHNIYWHSKLLLQIAVSLINFIIADLLPTRSEYFSKFTPTTRNIA